jgi:antitoxin Phd
MKVYTYSKAREKLADILEESKKEEVVIRRRRGDLYSIVPKPHPRRSPFDVAGLKKGLSRKQILDAIRESRERPVSAQRRAR